MKFGYLLVILFLFSACDKEDAYYNKLESSVKGKYKPLQLKSDIPVDVNGDGLASTELLQEIPELKDSNLELRVNAKDAIYYELFWQTQWFHSKTEGSISNPEREDPDNLLIRYANQATWGTFDTDKSFTKITLYPEGSRDATTIEGKIQDKTITITYQRRLFTKAGWKDVNVTGQYLKFSDSY